VNIAAGIRFVNFWVQTCGYGGACDDGNRVISAEIQFVSYEDGNIDGDMRNTSMRPSYIKVY
jgi:hypothetical protein